MNRAKRDFGSFHTSNVQELLLLPEGKYEPPDLIENLPLIDEQNICFGKEAKENNFFLEASCTFLNHGAFGSVLKQALEASQIWQRHIEKQPLRFYDRELLPHLVYITRRLAKFVGADASDLVLVPNVTTAINCVLRSQNLKPDDVVYHLSVEYGAVKKIIQQVCLQSQAKIEEVVLKFPLENKGQIIKLIKETLTDPSIKLAVFDHIPSNTPYILPVKEICDICHQRGVAVLIDGAHALGQLDLDISSLGDVDYYVSNAHKWFSAPKGSAFMYVHKKHQANTAPLVISHGYGSGFNSQFIWSGLRDYTSFLSLHTVIDFWEVAGPNRLRQYMYELAKEAGVMLQQKWGSQLLVPLEMTRSMLCVGLPAELYHSCDDVNYAKAEMVQNALYHSYNIEVPVKAVDGRLYVRLSVHIHNSLEDYKYLATSALQLTKNKLLG